MEAVLALIYSDDMILAVSRRDNPTAMGLIGGKVDEGETKLQALYREVEEETGLRLTKAEEIFSDFDGNMFCTTYLCEAEGEIVTNETGVVKAVTWTTLIEGPFGEYNAKLFNTLLNN